MFSINNPLWLFALLIIPLICYKNLIYVETSKANLYIDWEIFTFATPGTV